MTSTVIGTVVLRSSRLGDYLLYYSIIVRFLRVVHYSIAIAHLQTMFVIVSKTSIFRFGTTLNKNRKVKATKITLTDRMGTCFR